MSSSPTAAPAAEDVLEDIPIDQDYGALCQADIRAFYEVHNPSKLADVPKIMNDAKANGISSRRMFGMLYKRYNVNAFSNRDSIIQRTRRLYPDATIQEILHEMRKVELKGLEVLNTDDYFRGLQQLIEKKRVDSKRAAMECQHSPHRMKELSNTTSKAKVDEVMAMEAASWAVQILGEEATPSLKNATTSSDFAESLRDGVLLQIILQKLDNPNITKDQIKRPKSTGFHGRDNVTRFIHAVQKPPYGLRTEVLFTDVDLCDRKNDRAVITCLLSLAKIAYSQGVAPAPAIVQYDQEIEEQSKVLPTEAELDRVMEEPDEEHHEAAVDQHLADLEDLLLQYVDDETDGRRLIVEEEERVRSLAVFVRGKLIQELKDELLAQQRKEFELPPEESSPGLPVPQTNKSHIRRVKLPPPPPQLLQLVKSPEREPSVEPAAAPTSPSGSATKRYIARRGDEVDKRVGKAVNNVFQNYTAPGTKVKRLKQQGQYIIYHKITGKRTVCFIRVVQRTLMIRVGGGWEDFEDYLQRRMVDWEAAPKNRLNTEIHKRHQQHSVGH